MEHFIHWDCEADLRAARTIPKSYGISGLTAYGTLLSRYHYDWLKRELVRPYYFTDNERLPQYEIEAGLRRRVAALPNVETLYGWQSEEIVQDADPGPFVAAARAAGLPLTVVSDTRTGGRKRYGAGLVLVQSDQFVASAGEPGEDAGMILRRSTGG